MADLSFADQKVLQELKHELDCRRDLMNAATGYALKGLNAVFLLNGAAATAILNRGDAALYFAGVLFAFSALIAVINIGVSYGVNYFYSEPSSPFHAPTFHKLAVYIAALNIAITFAAIVAVSRAV